LAELVQTGGKVEHKSVRGNGFVINLHCPSFVINVQSSSKPVQDPIPRLLRRPDHMVNDIEDIGAE
jgi:hypothetical protein